MTPESISLFVVYLKITTLAMHVYNIKSSIKKENLVFKNFFFQLNKSICI